MNINKTIHEAMGLCWHKYGDPMTERPQIGRIECSDCGHWSYTGGNFPDYTAPVHYCALMDWMREKNRGLVTESIAGEMLFGWISRSRQEQITLIAEAIEAGVLK